MAQPASISRRTFLGSAAAVTATTALTRRGLGQGDQRPNILWLLAEDNGVEWGCYGEPLVYTPNVDRLAAEGVRYTNAFTNAPVCSASRSSFMTGMYCTSLGAHNHRSHRGDGFGLPDGVHVFTKYLRDAGYFTCIPGGKKTDWNFTVSEKPYDSNNWDDLKTHQPFFAQYQFSETHRKFKHCPEHPVDPDKVKLPLCYPDHPVAREDWALYLETINVLDQKIGQVLKKLEDDGLADNTLVFFFGDHGEPHIRAKQFLYDGGIHIPLVVRWPGHLKPGAVSDELVSALDFAPTCLDVAGAPVPKHMQGRLFLGDHKQPEPRYLFATRDRCDETVDRIRCVRDRRYKYIRNFMPERPYMQPNAYKERAYPVWNLVKQLKAEGKLTPEAALFAADTRPEEELYDLQKDPWEVHNLAADPGHQEILKQMRAALDKWIVDTDDQGRFPESQESQQKTSGRKGKEKAGKRLPKAGVLPTKGMTIAFVDSEETKAQPMHARNVLDGDPMTAWHTQWKDQRPGFPHEIRLDCGAARTIRGLHYLPRQDRGQNGRLRKYELYLSLDGEAWGKPVAAGEFADTLDEQEATFSPTQARYLRLVALSGYSGDIAAIAELGVVGE